MKFRAVSHVRLYETVADQITDLVRSNNLKPGDKLPPERELAAMLSISRGSLREACRVLESRGLIKSTPGGGRSIREIDKENLINTGNVILDLEKSAILELVEAREVIEAKIVEIAAQRATAEDVRAIAKALFENKEATEEGVGEREAVQKTKLDAEFHLSIARATHNFVFTNIMRLHLDLLRNTREKTWRIPGRRKEQHKEHEAIFDAIAAHDSQKAVKAILDHLRGIREAVTKMKI